MIYNYGTWNWANCWRITFILLLVSMFFGCLGWEIISQALGAVGGVAFIILFVVRFEDVQKVMDAGNRR